MTMSLDERVSLLERQLRRWRWIALAAIALAGVSLAAPPRWGWGHAEVRTRSLAIVDTSGETVATLAAETHGPLLRMHSDESSGSLMLGALAGDLGLAITDANQPRVLLALGEKGFPALSMADQTGRTRLLAGLDAEPSGGSPFLQMRDASGRLRIYALVTTKAHLLVRDEKGNPPRDVPAGIGPVTGEMNQ